MDANTGVSNDSKVRKNHSKTITASLAVTNAVWVNDYILRITFNDTTEQLVDFGPYLTTHTHPYIEPFKNLERFKSFYIDNGNLVWGKDWDMIFPTWKLHRGYLDI